MRYTLGTSKDISLKPESIEAAKTIGLKNLYEIYSVIENKDEENIIFETEIGRLIIPKETMKEDWSKVKAVYIDPATIEISDEKMQEKNKFQGEIIANIPELMIHQSILLIKVRTSDNEDNSSETIKHKDQTTILRIQIPITESDYKILEKIWIKIPPHSIRIYE
jgi:hypothetical protein